MTYENRSIGGLFLYIGRSPAGSCLLDEHLDADVLAHNESGAVQEEKRQKAAHAAVSVIERVDAEEVQDEYRHQDQRIIGRGLDEEFLAVAAFVEGVSRATTSGVRSSLGRFMKSNSCIVRIVYRAK